MRIIVHPRQVLHTELLHFISSDGLLMLILASAVSPRNPPQLAHIRLHKALFAHVRL